MAVPESQRFIAVNILICERVMQEAGDGVLSAIRMVDTFMIPKERPDGFTLNFWIVVSAKLKSGLPFSPVAFKVFGVDISGKRTLMGTEVVNPQPSPFEDIGPGAGLIIQFGLQPKWQGTGFVEIEIEGEDGVMARAPFNVVEAPARK